MNDMRALSCSFRFVGWSGVVDPLALRETRKMHSRHSVCSWEHVPATVEIAFVPTARVGAGPAHVLDVFLLKTSLFCCRVSRIVLSTKLSKLGRLVSKNICRAMTGVRGTGSWESYSANHLRAEVLVAPL